jgi:anion-transporting  ArsA/GET3 family ATPase
LAAAVPRVTILLGKGGTGRTTIGRALALNFAEQGSTALLHTQPSTQVPDERVHNLSVHVLDPEAILEDQVQDLVPLGPLTRMVTDHPAFASFLEIAPGIKEAAVVNHLHEFLGRRSDRVVVDGPATGHGLHFLQAPRKLEHVTTGKVARRLGEIDEMLRDPEHTEIVLVALPEELPALETRELARSLEADGFPVSGLVVNRMPPPIPFETGKLAGRPEPSPDECTRAGDGPTVGSIDAGEALSLLAAEREEAETWLDELEELDVPTQVVPSLPGRPELAREVSTFVEGFP